MAVVATGVGVVDGVATVGFAVDEEEHNQVAGDVSCPCCLSESQEQRSLNIKVHSDPFEWFESIDAHMGKGMLRGTPHVPPETQGFKKTMSQKCNKTRK